jgi:hypothetical protein
MAEQTTKSSSASIVAHHFHALNLPATYVVVHGYKKPNYSDNSEWKRQTEG